MRPDVVVFVLALLGAGASCAGTGGAQVGRIGRVSVSVTGWDDARVGAYIENSSGARTGWYGGRVIGAIPGCMYEYGSEDGLPEGPDDEDSTRESAPDREYVIPDEVGVTPRYHHFTVEDSANAPSLIRHGGCELRLEPVIGGKVHLILIARGVGFRECQDTTSVWVKPGVRTRWRLNWKVSTGGCSVKISRMERASRMVRAR